ncbi:MAG: hypothetical protein JSV24_07740 [Bacteroidales bacterium]|nr:MAG: hypothetical protein JSV24_07740 [Bacteroidales bacterium]
MIIHVLRIYPFPVLLALAIISLLSCKTQDLYLDYRRPLPEKMITDLSYTPGVPGNFEITGISLRDSLLIIDLEFLGFENQEFDLYFDGVYQKTMPPHATLYIERKGGTKSRGEKITRQLLFDITGLKHPDYDRVIITVAGYTQMVIFTY